MRLFLAAITAALFWLAVMVTIARIVLDDIVAVSLGVVVVAAVLIASALRHRARSRPHRSWPAAITGRPLAVVPARGPHPPPRPARRTPPPRASHTCRAAATFGGGNGRTLIQGG